MLYSLRDYPGSMTTITTSQISPWTNIITSINLIPLHFQGGWPNSLAEVKNLGSFNSIKNFGTFETAATSGTRIFFEVSRKLILQNANHPTKNSRHSGSGIKWNRNY